MRSRWLILVALIGSWPPAAAWCQRPPLPEPTVPSGESAAPGTPTAADRSPAAAQAQGDRHELDTIYLRDKDGKFVPVLGLPFEEFEQLLRLKKGIGSATPPPYVLKSMVMAGRVEGEAAQLTLKASIVSQGEGWIAVPLLMPTAALRKAALYAGPGEGFVVFDAERGGYVCWVKRQGDRTHEFELQLAVGLTHSGGERRLALKLPRATESLLTFTVPGVRQSATLASGDGLLTTSSSADSTDLRVLGAGGDVQLGWRTRPELVSALNYLEASGEISVQVESRHRITSDAKLRVRSLGGPLDRFVVRLPPGMELAPLPPATGYTLVPLATELSAEDQNIQAVEVRLERPTVSAGEVWLRTQMRPEVPADPLSPAKFVVEGAAKQRGTIDFLSAGEWQLTWASDESVHRIDVAPDQATTNVVARYEYFQQPCDLSLRVAARPSRLSVEPTHMVYVDARQVRLESLLKCRFRGARAAGLRLEMEGWSFERITPDAVFDIPVASEDGVLFFPFREEVQAPSDLEIKLEAHRISPPAGEPLEFGFPRPAASNIAPATVLVFAADNVELAPQAAEFVGLSSDPTSIRLPGRKQPPLVYRDLGGGEPALFVAGLRRLSRLTSVSGHARLRLEGQQLHIDQRLDYRVAHEPQRTFELLAPADVWTGGNLQVWMGEEPLSVTVAAPAEPAEPSLVRLQFSTPTDQLGPLQVNVRYTLPLRWNRQDPLLCSLPLVLPVAEGEVQLIGQQLEFSLPEGVQIEPQDDELDEQEGPSPVSDAGLAFNWPVPRPTSHWLLEPGQSAATAAISIAQLWVQTWLSPTIKQERVAVRLQTQRDSVLVRIDKAAKQSAVLTAVDGQKVSHTFRQPGVLVATIPPPSRGRECVLEVCYTVEPHAGMFGVLRDQWRPVHVEDAEPPRRAYWQLAMPEHEHLLLTTDEMTPEMAWSIGSGRWYRRPALDQRQLEAWIKATPQETLPRGANEYLFGTVGRWPTVSVTVVERQTLVIAVSGAMLCLGLLLLYVPVLRRIEIVLVAGLSLAAVGIAAPELALLLAQAAIVGLVILLGIAVWVRATTQPASGGVTPSASVRRPRESPSTQPPTPRQRSDRSSRVTSTAAAPPAILEVRP